MSIAPPSPAIADATGRRSGRSAIAAAIVSAIVVAFVATNRDAIADAPFDTVADITSDASPAAASNDATSPNRRSARTTPRTSSRSVVVETQCDTGQGIVTNRTIFNGGIAVNVRDGGKRFLSVYDNGSVTLFDREREVRCELSHASLSEVMARSIAEARQRPEHKAIGIDATINRDGDRYTCQFGRIRYVIETVAAPKRDTMTGDRTTDAEQPDRTIADGYALFADTSLRLNFARGSGGLPPFARLSINRRLAADDRVPTRTVVTVTPQQGEPWRLTADTQILSPTAADDLHLRSVELMARTYASVPLSEFAQ